MKYKYLFEAFDNLETSNYNIISTMDDSKITHNKAGEAVKANISTKTPDYSLDPAQHLRPNTASTSKTSALIILNIPLTDHDLLNRLHSHSAQTICADGGANRLHDLLTTRFPDLAPEKALSKTLPTRIHGDLDSLLPAVRALYGNLKVPITHDEDQYSTDFGKAIALALTPSPGNNNNNNNDNGTITDVLILGSLSGRVDQGLGLLHELYREQRHRHAGTRFWLFSECSVSTILLPGVSCLATELEEGLLARSVGLLPVFGKATISTGGLEWDVEAWETEMGGMVSTSNHVVGKEVWVETDREVLFTVEVVRERERGKGSEGEGVSVG